ncbi:HelD family protein [Enterococcus thailandicus]|uniref:HelD family protein n=1 Tax=Enterococcus TaxID=1350 RepID=UPI00244D8EBD|nr:UvrD-helicase domain-containing protein [Enterococcus thailandicus]MDT2845671.1 UvrD-helicase domain-containing protein [Enterococcus thailandicus]GMB99905.1 DNA helicase [Enterococcus thailandicus]
MKNVEKKEQQHLTSVYQELKAEKKRLLQLIQQKDQHGRQHIEEMTGDIRLNMDNITDNLDTFANIEALNRQIDQYNIQLDSARKNLEKVERLLASPYFGKISVDFLEEEPDEDFYIGINGFTTEKGSDLIYDWRSPIAELFYNNELGKSHYQVNNREIEVAIENRRQLITKADQLINYFDTKTTIQDDVLLDVLAQNTSSTMRDITATIQQEQNRIIRDQEAKNVLVNGVAGSGKTSTIMQRIAYLLYQNQQTYSAKDILIFSPNQAFGHYIADVLPSLGEENPPTLTILQLARDFSEAKVEDETTYFQRISRQEATRQERVLRSQAFITFILENTRSLQVTFNEVNQKKQVFFTPEQIAELFNSTPTNYDLRERIAGTKEKMLQQWEHHLLQQSQSAKLRNQLLELTEKQQREYFGKLLTEQSETALAKYAEILLRKKYRRVTEQINELDWLDSTNLIVQLYQAFTGEEYLLQEILTLDEAIIQLFIQHTLVEKLDLLDYKVILIDEIQDYTPAQLQLIRHFWPHADLTMVGDENQGIFNSQISFAEISELIGDSVVYYQLTTSYRSSGAITKLFASLLENPEEMQITPIRPDGEAIQWLPYDRLSVFIHLIEQLDSEKIYTILTKTLAEADGLRAELSDHVTKKVRILPIELAKGLEFDHVILFDVSDKNYQTEQDQRLLYTAISRGTQAVWITYEGELTRFLTEQLKKN